MKIAVFGDSITEGQYVGAPLRWADRFAVEAQRRNEANEIFILGVSGETTRQGLERLQKQLQPLCPEVVYFQFGLNDCNYWDSDHGLPRVSQAGFEANLVEMICRFRRFGATEVFLANNYRPNRPKVLVGGVSLQESNVVYNKISMKVAQNTGARFVDMFSRFDQKFADFDYLIEDGVHLSRIGHEFYANCVQEEFEIAGLL